VNFPEVAQNVATVAPLTRGSLIVVPPNTLIQGTVAADGTYESIIQWSNNSIPTFVFDNSSGSSMKDLHIQFTGTMPSLFPYYGDEALLQALGYNSKKPQGGPYEIFTFAYVFNSEYCTFDHLLFDSATRDNAHVFGFALNLKGKGVIENNGGGFSELASGNSITNLQLYDFVNALLTAGQNNLLIENIVADRRGSTISIPPGHLLYTTSLVEYQTSGGTTVQTYISSTNVTINNVTEGPDTYSNVESLGTLATKFINGGKVTNIQSQHPMGLDQSIQSVQNMTFSNMNWSSNYPVCKMVPANCYVAIINFAGSPAGLPPNENLTFTNISLAATAEPIIGAIFNANNLTVDGLTIMSSPSMLPAQTTGRGIVETELMNQASIRNFTYIPIISSYNPKTIYNGPFLIWNQSTNVNAAVTINWPSALPVPPAGSPIITSAVANPTGANNSVIQVIK
jgi:hypothetical protein